MDEDAMRQGNPRALFNREKTFEIPSHNNNKPLELHRLRYQLATEGCSDSQTSLAKSLLQERTANTNEKRENEELAVRWLLMAASEGHPEALQYLKECYKLGIGISPANKESVEKCLNSTAEEKIAQYVGQRLFRLMSFDMKEPIPLSYFKLKVDSFLYDEEIDTEKLESSDQNCSDGKTISVEQVISSIQQSQLGKKPEVFIWSPIPPKQKINNKVLDYMACKGIIILSSVINLLKCLSDASVIHSLLIVGVLAALFLMFLPTLLVDQAHHFIVNATNAWVSCSSYIVMIFSSAKLLYRHQAYANSLKWISVVKKFEVKLRRVPELNSYNMELKLLILQTISAVVFVTYTKELFEWIVSRHLLFLSLIFFIATKPDNISTILYTVHFLTAFTKFLILPVVYPEWKEFHVLQIRISKSLQLNISPIAILLLFFIVLHVFAIIKSKKKNYILNLSGVLWINIFVGSLSAVTSSNLTSDFMFIGLLVMGSNKMTHLTTYGVGLVAESAMGLTMNGSAFGIGAFIFIVFTSKVSKYLQIKIGSAKIIPLCLMILCASVLYLTTKNNKVTNTKSTKEISWPNYASQCHQPAWSESNMARVQIHCDKYQGYKMTIIGSVASVKRVKKENQIEVAIYSVSKTVQSWLRFIFDEDIVAIAVNKLSDCCLQKWVANQYEIKVQLKGTFRIEAELIFTTNDFCDQFVLKLHENDDVKITGMFLDGIGADRPILSLIQGRCLSCVEKILCNPVKVPTDSLSTKNVTATNLSIFFFEPFAFISGVES